MIFRFLRRENDVEELDDDLYPRPPKVSGAFDIIKPAVVLFPGIWEVHRLIKPVFILCLLVVTFSVFIRARIFVRVLTWFVVT